MAFTPDGPAQPKPPAAVVTSEQDRIEQEMERAKAAFTGKIKRHQAGTARGRPRAAETKRDDTTSAEPETTLGLSDEGKMTGRLSRELASTKSAFETKLDLFEDKRATGFQRRNRAYIASSGLVSRRGYLRVLQEEPWLGDWERNRALDELEEIAAKVLHL